LAGYFPLKLRLVSCGGSPHPESSHNVLLQSGMELIHKSVYCFFSCSAAISGANDALLAVWSAKQADQ
jgi:hypothetical protein